MSYLKIVAQKFVFADRHKRLENMYDFSWIHLCCSITPLRRVKRKRKWSFNESKSHQVETQNKICH